MGCNAPGFLSPLKPFYLVTAPAVSLSVCLQWYLFFCLWTYAPSLKMHIKTRSTPPMPCIYFHAKPVYYPHPHNGIPQGSELFIVIISPSVTVSPRSLLGSRVPYDILVVFRMVGRIRKRIVDTSLFLSLLFFSFFFLFVIEVSSTSSDQSLHPDSSKALVSSKCPILVRKAHSQCCL